MNLEVTPNREAAKASFSFEHYRIVNFAFAEPKTDTVGLFARFDPSGKYNPKTGQFLLIFGFSALYGENQDQELMTATVEASFKFEEPAALDELPDYFYRNSIAIVFPYLRAFATTLTSVANIKPLILPVLNLSALEEPFRNNTIIEEN